MAGPWLKAFPIRDSGYQVMKPWKKVLLCFCLISMLMQQVSANAVLAPVENYVVNRAIAGIVANRIAAAEGIAANDAIWLAKAANNPVYASTMAGISRQMSAVNVASTVVGGALAIAGAPLWLTIAAGLGITALGAYYFSSDKTQKVSIFQSGSSVVIQTQSSPSKVAYTPPGISDTGNNLSVGALGLLAGLIVYRSGCAQGGDCLSFPPAPVDYFKTAPFIYECCDAIVIAYSLAEITNFTRLKTDQDSSLGIWNGYYDTVSQTFTGAYLLPRSGSVGQDLYGSFTIYRTPKPVTDASGVVTAGQPKITYENRSLKGWVIGANAPISQTFTNLTQAYPALTAVQKAIPVPDEQLALLANEAWKRAAADPAYKGLPYVATKPLTSSDVSTWKTANPSSIPTLDDMLRPAQNPTTDPNGVPISPSGQPNSNPVPNPNPGTNPGTNSSGRPDLGPDPNVADPTLETTPDAATILSPLTSLFPELRSYQVPGHLAQCPKPTFDLFGRSIVMDAQCTIAEQHRSELAAVMMVVWLLVGLFILLSA